MNCKFLRGDPENKRLMIAIRIGTRGGRAVLSNLRNNLRMERWPDSGAKRSPVDSEAELDHQQKFAPFRESRTKNKAHVVYLSEPANCQLSVAAYAADAAATPLAFSFVPDSGTSAAALSPSLTLGTVACTSVIGRPWVGAIVLTPSRSIRWSSRSQ